MKIELHKDIEGTIKTMTIKREGREYYAIFIAANNSEVKKVEDARPVGIDLGLNSFIAMSDGKKAKKPKFFKKSGKRIARWQRIVARRTRHEGKRMAKLQS
ncbi:transposase, IS605 OrfB family, partial [mine drainage metagenome]